MTQAKQVNRLYFKDLMQDRGMSMRALAKRMGLGHSQLSLTFSGGRQMQIGEAVELASILNEPLKNIIEGAGIDVRLATVDRVSVVGYMRGDGTVTLQNEEDQERINSPEGLPAESVALQLRTESTPMDWLDGVVMFFRKPGGVDLNSLGRLSFCKIADGPAVLAAVRRGYKAGTFNLHGPYSAESVCLEFATPALISRH